MLEPAKQTLDFIVIGAAKAGTASLFEYLRQHPELALPPSHGAPYFSSDARVANGWEGYLQRFFAGADPARRWGTVTVQYMFGAPTDVDGTEPADYDEHTIPSRIRAQLPDVRLVAILRDPVERALSDHRMSHMLGRDSRPADVAFSELLTPSALKHSRRHPTDTNRYVTTGEYGRILTAYFDAFPRDQLLVVFAEEFKNFPEQVMARILAFLGVRHDILPENLTTKYNTGADQTWLSPLAPYAIQGALARNGLARAGWHAMSIGTRKRALLVFDRLSYEFWLRNRRKGKRHGGPMQISPGTLQRLREHFTEDQEQLSTLLGITPPYTATPHG